MNEAQDFIKDMPLKPSVDVWGSLLGASRVHSNADLVELAAEHIFELAPDSVRYYVLLSNLYATLGRRVDVAKVRAMINDRGLKKELGCSWIDVGNNIHAFFVGDISHPRFDEIYATLKNLAV